MLEQRAKVVATQGQAAQAKANADTEHRARSFNLGFE